MNHKKAVQEKFLRKKGVNPNKKEESEGVGTRAHSVKTTSGQHLLRKTTPLKLVL